MDPTAKTDYLFTLCISLGFLPRLLHSETTQILVMNTFSGGRLFGLKSQIYYLLAIYTCMGQTVMLKLPFIHLKKHVLVLDARDCGGSKKQVGQRGGEVISILQVLKPSKSQITTQKHDTRQIMIIAS